MIKIQTLRIVGLLAVCVCLAGCMGEDSKSDKQSGKQASTAATPSVTIGGAGSTTKLKVVDELRDESTGITLVRRHKDEVLNLELKTEVTFKDGAGLRERNNMGRITKLEFTAKNGSRVERVFQGRNKASTKFTDKSGRLEREVIREDKNVIVVEYAEDGSKSYWTPTGPSGKPAIFWEDGKTLHMQVAADGGPALGPWEIYDREGRRLYDQTISGGFMDRQAHVRFYRADGKTVWFEQFWVFPVGAPVLRQAREYDENNNLVREVLPTSQKQPSESADAPMGVKNYDHGNVTSSAEVDQELLKQTRANPTPDQQMPSDALARLLSRPAPTMSGMIPKLLQYKELPDESMLDKLAEI